MAWEAFVSYLLCFAPHIPTTLTFHLFLKYVHAHTRANVCNTVFAENSSQRSPQCFLPLSIWITALKITFFTGVLFDYLVYLLLCLAVFLFLALIAILQSTVICLLILSFLLGYKFHEERDYYSGFIPSSRFFLVPSKCSIFTKWMNIE